MPRCRLSLIDPGLSSHGIFCITYSALERDDAAGLQDVSRIHVRANTARSPHLALAGSGYLWRVITAQTNDIRQFEPSGC